MKFITYRMFDPPNESTGIDVVKMMRDENNLVDYNISQKGIHAIYTRASFNYQNKIKIKQSVHDQMSIK